MPVWTLYQSCKLSPFYSRGTDHATQKTPLPLLL
jgi:hypothetical protein